MCSSGRSRLILALWALVTFTSACDRSDSSRRTPQTATPLERQLSAMLAEHSVPADHQGPIQLVFRHGGRKGPVYWIDDHPWSVGLPKALSLMSAKAKVGQRSTIELIFSKRGQVHPPNAQSWAFSNIHRGILGISIWGKDYHERIGPTEVIAHNRSLRRWIERVQERRGPADRIETFEAFQFLIRWQATPTIQTMHRGNVTVPIAAVTQENVKALATRMAGWLATQVHSDGRMTYKYWPSRGEESQGNNAIRQWMASVCLARLNRYGLLTEPNIVERNIAYNLKTMYREENGLGIIQLSGKAKLGAIALAALAIREAALSEKTYTHIEDALFRTTVHLNRDDGAFHTFYLPSGRNDNQNFYPGEALLYWAVRLQATPDVSLEKRFFRAFEHYRNWHLRPENRNPAFVPWHTQANYLVWKKTRSDPLRQFIFQMNDWLLSMQQRANDIAPDLRGRFYDPQRTNFGPPHASSTGVYLEGLIDAYALAKAAGNEPRRDAYRIAIVWALRSLMQLEFSDDTDMFYISQRDRVRGGLRTTVYDNTIRVDNVQHGLMGILKVLDSFTPTDYGLDAH